MKDWRKLRRASHVKHVAPRTASAILRDIFNLMLVKKVRLEDMAQALGKHANRISEYRRGLVEPGVITVENMAEVIGHRLVLKPLDGADETIVAPAMRIGKTIHMLPPPARHHDILKNVDADYWERNRAWTVRGFLTSAGRFVVEVKAAEIAITAGQVRHLASPPNLQTEDLW